MTKALVQRRDSMPEHMQYSCLRHLIHRYHLNLFINTHTHTHIAPLLMYSILLASSFEILDGNSTVSLYVFAWHDCVCAFENARCKLCPVLTSRTRGCFYSCISCVSSLRRQDWRVREKEPSTEEEWDWSFARQPQLEATIQMIFPTIPRPRKPSTVHPLSTPPRIHFWTCTDNRISGELSKQTALCCNVDCVFAVCTNRDYSIRWVSVATALSAF